MSEQRLFTRLADISKNDHYVNIFAVVKFLTKPKTTKGTDKSFFFNVVDPTLYEHEASLKCICFEKDEKNFPVINSVGDVVKFTSLSISEFKTQVRATGSSKKGFSWVTFDGRLKVPVSPRFSPNSQRNLSEEDKKKVEELKSWASTIETLCPLTKRLTLEKLTAGNLYFDLLCQVVCVEILDSRSCIIHVWDGTVPGLCSLVSSNQLFSTKWGDKVNGKCAKIYVYSNVSDVEILTKTADYVLVTNLHLKSKESVVENEPTAKKLYVLVLHEGRDFGRGINVISEDDPDVKELVGKMKVLPTNDGEEPRPIVGTYKYARATFFALKVPKTISNNDNSACEYLTPQVTSIQGLKANQEVPGLFLVKARVYAYWPKNGIEMARYVCHYCKKIYMPSDIVEVFNADIIQSCLNSGCGRPLSLSLFFSLILRDRAEFIDVVVFDRDTKTFFPDVDLVALYNDKGVQEWLEKRLNCLKTVWVEYVILSCYAGLTSNDGQPLPVYRLTETRFPAELEECLKREVAVTDT